MNYIIAILLGFLFAEIINFLLDYLPYTRKLTGKKIRDIRISGSNKSTIDRIESTHLPSIDKIFSSVDFPFCRRCHSRGGWFSYLFGKSCSHCGANAKKRFWLLIIGLPLAFISLTIWPVEGFRIVDIHLLLSFYIIIFIMDVEHRVILLPITIFGILFGLYFGLSYHSVNSTISGGLAGGGIMLFFYWFGIFYIRMIRKTSNPNMYEVALGFGDVTLSLILGLILGWPGIMGGLFLGIFIGGVISGLLLLIKFATKQYAPNDLILPYAPFLVIGAFVIMLI